MSMIRFTGRELECHRLKLFLAGNTLPYGVFLPEDTRKILKFHKGVTHYLF